METNLILITGITGSGKTTISNILNTNDKITKISLDWFYKDIPNNINPEIYDFDDPSAIDWIDVTNVIKKLLNNEEVQLIVYDFTTHKHNTNVPKIILKPNELIILEGVFAAHDSYINSLAKKIIYISTDTSLCLARRIKRDINERGRTLDFVLHQWNTFVYPSFKKYIEPQQYHNKCIIIYNNNKIDLDKININELIKFN